MRSQPHLTAQAPDRAITAFLGGAGNLYVSEDLDETLLRLTTTVVGGTPGCGYASLTVATDGGGFMTHGATDPRARRIDEIQYQTGQGPCLDAATNPAHTAPVYVPNTGNDPRWPAFCARAAAELGAGSLLSCQLSLAAVPNRSLGALNLNAPQPGQFDPHDRDLALLYAAVAAIVLDAARRQVQLRHAMAARDVIGQAIGVLMVQRDISTEEAFDQLRRISQRLNIKLRDVAIRIVASTGPRTGEREPDQAAPRPEQENGQGPSTTQQSPGA